MARSIASIIETALLELDQPIELRAWQENGKVVFTVDSYPYSFTRPRVLEALRDLYNKVTGHEY